MCVLCLFAFFMQGTFKHTELNLSVVLINMYLYVWNKDEKQSLIQKKSFQGNYIGDQYVLVPLIMSNYYICAVSAWATSKTKCVHLASTYSVHAVF